MHFRYLPAKLLSFPVRQPYCDRPSAPSNNELNNYAKLLGARHVSVVGPGIAGKISVAILSLAE